jgi:preprotein translocase subunit YajC
MTSFFWILLPAQASPPDSPLIQFVPFVLIFLVFYAFFIRPMNKKQQVLEEMQNNLNKGDRVVTNGGFYGKVVKTDGDVVVLELADNVRVRVTKRAIGGLEGQPENGSK